jgi:hypothetical protein
VSPREPRQPGRHTRRALRAVRRDQLASVTGRYELRPERRMGVELVGIWWCPPGEPPIRVTEMVPERLPLLAEALNSHLADDPAR